MSEEEANYLDAMNWCAPLTDEFGNIIKIVWTPEDEARLDEALRRYLPEKMP